MTKRRMHYAFEAPALGHREKRANRRRPPSLAAIRKAADEGLTAEQMCARFAITRTEVRAYCKTAGVRPAREPRLSKAEKRRRDLARERTTQAQERAARPARNVDRLAVRVEAGAWKRHHALDANYRDARGRQMMRDDGLYSGEGCLIECHLPSIDGPEKAEAAE